MSRFQTHARRLRESSPRADDYHTGVSSINLEEALHSTQQFGHTEQDQERWPSHWDRDMERRASAGSDGSASMSIELGRGIKRSGDELDDVSSPYPFQLNDSLYEFTGTPPLKGMLKKSEDLRRQASMRNANEGAKRTISRSVSAPKPEPISLQTRLANNKNTRFTQKPAARGTPAKMTEVGDTATSFAVPDISGVGNLIDPAGDNTSRSLPSKNRSRFTPSATHRMPVRFDGPDRVPVQSVPIPEDEKKIYAALQALQDKVNQLEFDHSEMSKQLDHYEKENIQLRNALAREEQLRRPDSALGSEDETAQGKWRLQRTQLQANLHGVRQQLELSERKVKGRDDELQRAAREKQDLVTQLGVECYRVQEIESENMALREDHVKLQAEIGALRQQLYNTRRPQRSLADDIVMNKTRPSKERRRDVKSKSEPTQDVKAQEATINFENLDAQSRHNIAEIVKQQFERQRQRRPSYGARTSMFDLEPRPPKSMTTPHLPQYQAAVHDETNDEVYTEFEMTKNTTHNMSRRSMQTLEDNMTDLTINPPEDIEEVRRDLEARRRAGHLKRQSLPASEVEHTLPQPARRSSLRDPGDMSAHKETRTVRVQSPAVEDLTDASLPARRQHEEGETSEFIIPDITLHRRPSRSDLAEHSTLKHEAASCTVCNDTPIKNMSAPVLQRVSVRTDLPEDATVRPSQPPPQALSSVLRQLHDELAHLKLVLAKYQKQHAVNEPAIGARDRKHLYDKIEQAMSEVKRKEDQIYALYDALEGQVAYEEPQPVEKAKPKRSSGFGYDGAYDVQTDEESVGLPAWEGLSDDEH